MKIILAENSAEKTLTFADVEINQFFVNNLGHLCQKVTTNQYNVLAEYDGLPYADQYRNVSGDIITIKRILPKVERIEF